ncbi:hypothetical protein Slin14017_G066210 [Septoria linicola]|nr:hypothetical protein Slin14017_G066210 [Septoria linicola]
MASTKPPKPSQMFVEVSPEPPEPRLRGPLRGLNPNINILPNSVQGTVEDEGDDDDNDENVAPIPNKHTTRASRGNSKAVSYDMKYHPMDVVTRPNSAAVRRRSKSVSFAGSDDNEGEAESSDGDVSSQSSPQESDGTSAESSKDENDNRPRPTQTVLGRRTPDPCASRHSARRAARKPVIYSTKHHPQDYDLPGFRSRAIVVLDDSESEAAPSEPAQSPKQPKKRKAATLDDEARGEGDTIAVKDGPRRPHKKLKSLNDTRPGRAKKRKPGRPTKAKPQVVKRAKRAEMEIDNLVEMAIRGSQPAEATELSSDNGSDEEEEHLDAAEQESAQDNYQHLLTACTQISNLLDVDDSGVVIDDTTAEVDGPSTATIDTTATLNAESETAATSCQDEIEELLHLPTYIKDRLALDIDPRAPISASVVVRMMFGGQGAGSLSDLVIEKPYLHYPLAMKKLTQDSMAAKKLTQESIVADSENEEDDLELEQEDPDADPVFKQDDPYETNTPVSNEFEEGMAGMESPQVRSSDPIHYMDEVDDEPERRPQMNRDDGSEELRESPVLDESQEEDEEEEGEEEEAEVAESENENEGSD